MLQDTNKTAIFSGRFDCPHVGHFLSILELARLYGKVAVIILDYPGRETCSADEARDIFNKLFDLVFPPIARQVVQVEVNDIHFAHISFSEYDTLLRNIGCCMNHSIYVSGNREVLDNMTKQGIKARYFARSDDYIYTGTKIREKMAKLPPDAIGVGVFTERGIQAEEFQNKGLRWPDDVHKIKICSNCENYNYDKFWCMLYGPSGVSPTYDTNNNCCGFILKKDKKG